MASEGSREIAAARRCLAAAKAQKKSAKAQKKSASKLIQSADEMAATAQNTAETAKKMAAAARDMDKSAKEMTAAAKKNKEEAQLLLQISKKEVQEAKAFLEASEKRWDVIDVDVDIEKTPESGNKKKKRKTTTSNLPDGPTNESVNLQQTQTSSGEVVAGGMASVNQTDVDKINVYGGGCPEINGTYYRTGTKGVYSGCYSYSKTGFWKGPAQFRITISGLHWYINVCRGDTGGWDPYLGLGWKTLYRTLNSRTDYELPPQAGWMTMNGESPAPKLNW